MRKWIQAKIDRYVINRFKAIMPRQIIISLYKKLRLDSLMFDMKVVKVKKGKKKHYLMFIDDGTGKTVYNLGRNMDADPVLSNRSTGTLVI